MTVVSLIHQDVTTKEKKVRLVLSRPRAVVAAAAVLVLAAVAGCGSDDNSSGSSGGGGDAKNAKIAFLMPDTASTRYELADKPLFEKRLKEICPDCSVLYQNADSDAAKQQQQVDSALTQGVKVIVLDPVDSAAAATMVQKAQSQDVAIIAYDRPIPKAKADYYVSFDNEKLGAMFAQSLVDKVKADNPNGGILQVNGSPTDAAAGLIKKGMHSAIDPSGLKLLAEFDTPDWAPPKAQDWVAGQISKFPGKINGVVAANDGTGGGAIAAFKAAGVKPVPPVSGNDAELAAAQRIISGDQYNTISKPIKIVAGAAADVAYAFASGKPPAAKTTLFDTPSQLFVPKVVTRENVKELLIDTGEIKPADLCTKEYAKDCAELGIE
jgi:D-xylose transport system substrate-binding protein